MEKSGLKNVKLADIRPYAKNPRINDASVEYVANSIKAFGHLDRYYGIDEWADALSR